MTSTDHLSLIEIRDNLKNLVNTYGLDRERTENALNELDLVLDMVLFEVNIISGKQDAIIAILQGFIEPRNLRPKKNGRKKATHHKA